MKMKIFNRLKFVIAGVTGLIALNACENVEDGYRIDYKESSATFKVSLLTLDRGAKDDTIRYFIEASSEYDIKSLVVETSVSGKDNSGFKIDTNSIDPLIDHIYGTIQDGTRQFSIYYNYVVSQDTVDATLYFSLIDQEGARRDTQKIYTVPAIIPYNNIVMYTQTSSLVDGFSTYDGLLYHNLTNYDDVTDQNKKIQKSLDVIYVVENGVGYFVAPYNSKYSGGISVKNKTIFSKMDNLDDEKFSQLTNASLSKYTEEAKVKNGSTVVQVNVGDFIGYRTDLASTNSYKYGIARVKALHPANSEYYQGTCYLIEMDVVTQK